MTRRTSWRRRKGRRSPRLRPNFQHSARDNRVLIKFHCTTRARNAICLAIGSKVVTMCLTGKLIGRRTHTFWLLLLAYINLVGAIVKAHFLYHLDVRWPPSMGSKLMPHGSKALHIPMMHLPKPTCLHPCEALLLPGRRRSASSSGRASHF